MNLIYDYIGNFILSIAEVYAWYSITKKNKPKNYIVLLLEIMLLSLFITINHNYINNFMKGIGVVIIAIVFCKTIIKIRINECITLSFISELLVIFSEALLVLLSTIIFKTEMNHIAESIYIHIIFDFLIAILVIN